MPKAGGDATDQVLLKPCHIAGLVVRTVLAHMTVDRSGRFLCCPGCGGTAEQVSQPINVGQYVYCSD